MFAFNQSVTFHCFQPDLDVYTITCSQPLNSISSTSSGHSGSTIGVIIAVVYARVVVVVIVGALVMVVACYMCHLIIESYGLPVGHQCIGRMCTELSVGVCL